MAPSTVATYDSVLHSEVDAISESMGVPLLPLETKEKFFSLFGGLLARHGANLHWSRMRLLKSALLQHHARLGLNCVLRAWAFKMSGFWSDLARVCPRESIGKTPIGFPEVVKHLELHHKDLSLPVIRNTAMLAVGFLV